MLHSILHDVVYVMCIYIHMHAYAYLGIIIRSYFGSTVFLAWARVLALLALLVMAWAKICDAAVFLNDEESDFLEQVCNLKEDYRLTKAAIGDDVAKLIKLHKKIVKDNRYLRGLGRVIKRETVEANKIKKRCHGRRAHQVRTSENLQKTLQKHQTEQNQTLQKQQAEDNHKLQKKAQKHQAEKNQKKLQKQHANQAQNKLPKKLQKKV